MKTQSIMLRVIFEAAHIFEATSEEEMCEIEAMVSLKLTDVVGKAKPLEEVISEISQKAQKRGLTPEILDSILNE
jgi:hypothetical protein